MAAIVLAFGACVMPEAATSTTEEAALRLVLPPRYEHWRPGLEAELATMTAEYFALRARWSEEPPVRGEPPVLLLAADGLAAAALYAELGLAGDPAVPRTFPAERLAVVPLMRDDALLAALPAPPATLRHTLRHEAVHLLSLDDAPLRAAPDWFQEGLAEAWCSASPLTPVSNAWPHAFQPHRRWSGTWEEAPAEVRYASWAEQVRAALATETDPPWTGLAPAFPTFAASDGPALLRGRDADWSADGGRLLLAAPAGEQVDLELAHAWDGTAPLRLELQLGRTGQPEAGLLLLGAPADALAAPRVRLRYGLAGGLALYGEEAGLPARVEALELPAGEPRPGRKRMMSLERRGESLVLRAEGFRRQVNLAALGLRFPLHLRMYVRDGAFRAVLDPPPGT
jgi:hypothetical protein